MVQSPLPHLLDPIGKAVQSFRRAMAAHLADLYKSE